MFRLATVLFCSEQKEKRGGLRHKVYVNKFTSHESEVVGQLSGQVIRFVKILEAVELQFSSRIKENSLKEKEIRKIYVCQGELCNASYASNLCTFCESDVISVES